MTLEQMVREILEAVKKDKALFSEFCAGKDPQHFSGSDLVFPANRLKEILAADKPTMGR